MLSSVLDLQLTNVSKSTYLYKTTEDYTIVIPDYSRNCRDSVFESAEDKYLMNLSL